MAVMIKLQLSPGVASLDQVENLPGLHGLSLDRKFGVILIDPKSGLYVIRADSVNDLEERRRQSPEILEAYGDIKISTS